MKLKVQEPKEPHKKAPAEDKASWTRRTEGGLCVMKNLVLPREYKTARTAQTSLVNQAGSALQNNVNDYPTVSRTWRATTGTIKSILIPTLTIKYNCKRVNHTHTSKLPRVVYDVTTSNNIFIEHHHPLQMNDLLSNTKTTRSHQLQTQVTPKKGQSKKTMVTRITVSRKK